MSRLALVQMVGSAKLVRVGTRAVSLAMADFRSNSAILSLGRYIWHRTIS